MSLPPPIPCIQAQTAGPDPDFTLPKLSSLAIIVITNLLLQISLFIIVPTSNEYAKYLGGNSTFAGLVIGLPTLVASLALFPLMQYDGGGYRRPLRLSCVACILGNVLYSLAYVTSFLYLILIGRIVNGFGFTMLMYCKRYCSDPRIVGIRRRTTLAGFLVMGQGLGTSAGPFFGGLLFKIAGSKNPIFNGFTSPGWVMAIVWLIFGICAEIWFEDVPDDQEYLPASAASSPPEKSTSQVDVRHQDSLPLSANTSFSHLSFSQMGVMICMCWFAIACFFVLGAWESNLPTFGAAAPALQWSPFAAGNFIALGGIAAFPFLLANIFLARRVDDRRILAFGSNVGLAALLTFLTLLKTNKINYASMVFCWWAVAVGFHVASTVPVSLLSKQLPPSWNNKTSVIIQHSMYIGRATGTVWGGSGVHVGMVVYSGVEIAFTVIGIALYAVVWRELKAKRG
ncbi:Major facilitator superfamily domain containing protein [Amanita muscaria]